MTSLTVSFVHQTIDEVIGGTDSCQEELQSKGFTLRRATTPTEWNSMLALVSNESSMDSTLPFYFGLGLRRESDDAIICGAVTFYSAYSTWDGRTLFVDRLEFPADQDATIEKLFLRTLAKIAVKLGCTRLTWRHIETPSWYEDDPNPPEILRGWLTLQMDRPSMANYAGVSEAQSNVTQHNFSRTFVEQTVTECLAAGVNESTDAKFRLRLASRDDVNTIVRLVQGLAVYEKEPDAVNLTAEDYLLDGGSEEPLFYCLMLDYVDGDKPVYTCGMSFLYFGYILGEGRFLYLEDLFLEEAYRKRGGGSLAMKSLARLSTALECTQFYWVALDWNTPALNLYKKIGAKVQEGVFTTRYGGEALKSFASD